MASQKKSAFLTEHYDKLVLVAALAVLVAALAALLVGAGSSKAESAKFARRIQALSNLERRNVQVVPGLLFAAAREAARVSYAMSGTNVAFLVAPERVSCVKCAQPHVAIGPVIALVRIGAIQILGFFTMLPI